MDRMIAEVQLPLTELKAELEKLENYACTDISDKALREKISRLHAGYHMSVVPIDRGTIIYRAVNVASLGMRPVRQSQVSYPPREVPIGRGRLNRAGESVFYGALAGYYGSILECSSHAGQIFALSSWKTREALSINYVGYSKAVIEAATKREPPAFTNDNDVTERDAIIGDWHSRIFTRSGKDSESTYRLTIALKELTSSPGVRELHNGRNHISGTMYPSVAASLGTDNIALRPDEVDSKLELVEVLLLVLHSREVETSQAGELWPIRLDLRYYDFARPDEDGNLIWGQQSQVVSASFDATTFRQQRLRPNTPYSNVGWRNFR